MYLYAFTFILKNDILISLKTEIKIYRGVVWKREGEGGGCRGLDPHACLEKLNVSPEELTYLKDKRVP